MEPDFVAPEVSENLEDSVYVLLGRVRHES